MHLIVAPRWAPQETGRGGHVTCLFIFINMMVACHAQVDMLWRSTTPHERGVVDIMPFVRFTSIQTIFLEFWWLVACLICA